jgi:hypothetical protein
MGGHRRLIAGEGRGERCNQRDVLMAAPPAG